MQPETPTPDENIPPPSQPESQPIIVTPPAPEDTSKKKRKLIPLIIAVVVLLFLGASTVAGYIAYQRIYLSPDRVLGKMLADYEDVKTFSYNAKVNMHSDDPSAQFDFDLLAYGKSDLLDESAPKNYGKYEAYVNKLKITELEYVSLSKDIYLRLNYLLSFGYKIDDLKNIWIKINTDEVLRQFLGEVPEVLEPEEEKVKNLNEELGLMLQEKPPFKVVENLGSDEVDGHSKWHYKLEIDKENLLEYVQKVADSGADLYSNNIYGSKYMSDDYTEMLEEINFDNIELWVDKKQYLARKLKLILSPNMVSGYEEIDEDFIVNIEIIIDNYDQDQAIKAPSEFLTTDEFMAKLQLIFINPQEDSNEFMDLFDQINPQQFKQARDTQRRSDLLSITNAIYQFAAEHNGNLPDTDGNDTTSNFPLVKTCIGTQPSCFDLGKAGGVDLLSSPDYNSDPIVPTYIADIPIDPSIGTGADTGYTIYVNQDGRIVAEATGELTPVISVVR